MLPAGARIWLVAGVTDMRKGMDTLCALVQTALADNPFSGQVFIFRGRRGDRVKILWWSGDGMWASPDIPYLNEGGYPPARSIDSN